MVCQLAGIIGSIFTVSSVSTWYIGINKPIFNPPSWIFGPVWIILYLLMGISLYLIWNRNKVPIIAISWFGIQLVLNSLWSFLFFGLKSPLFSGIEIILLWMTIMITIYYFNKISKMAAYLLIPYFFWVTFAAILNFTIWWIN